MLFDVCDGPTHQRNVIIKPCYPGVAIVAQEASDNSRLVTVINCKGTRAASMSCSFWSCTDSASVGLRLQHLIILIQRDAETFKETGRPIASQEAEAVFSIVCVAAFLRLEVVLAKFASMAPVPIVRPDFLIRVQWQD